MKQYIYKFLLILGAAVASAALGALFAAVIALLSPEFVSNLFQPETGNLVRYAAAVGMIWGLFIGAAAMAFVLALAAIVQLLKPLSRKAEES
ncbi:MAG: hypothetical protein ACYTFI_15040 [Planctomycetota bacterium]|jgi:hypothetical protein